MKLLTKTDLEVADESYENYNRDLQPIFDRAQEIASQIGKVFDFKDCHSLLDIYDFESDNSSSFFHGRFSPIPISFPGNSNTSTKVLIQGTLWEFLNIQYPDDYTTRYSINVPIRFFFEDFTEELNKAVKMAVALKNEKVKKQELLAESINKKLTPAELKYLREI